MTNITITESGMEFGPFEKACFFHVEKSESYLTIQENVKIAEFVLLPKRKKQEIVWIVEAKSSSPKPDAGQNIDDFIEEIRDKFSNTMFLYFAGLLGRQSGVASELSAKMKALSPKTVDFRFILVISGHSKEWLEPLKEILSSALKPLIKIWNLSPETVIVLNDELARKYLLIK